MMTNDKHSVTMLRTTIAKSNTFHQSNQSRHAGIGCGTKRVGRLRGRHGSVATTIVIDWWWYHSHDQFLRPICLVAQHHHESHSKRDPALAERQKYQHVLMACCSRGFHSDALCGPFISSTVAEMAPPENPDKAGTQHHASIS